MKKPIDPNLNNLTEEDFLLKADDIKKESKLGFSGEILYKNPKEPDFKVTVNNSEENQPEKAAVDHSTSSGSHHHSSSEHHHSSSEHHHSSSEHHHSSSGHHSSHHSSGSSHHHSSTSHHSSGSHSSSGSHHHSSSRRSSSSSSKKKKSKLPVAARIAIIIAAVILLIILIAVGTFLYLKYTGQKDVMPVVTENTSYEETIDYNGHTYKYDDDVIAIAFMGIDQRDLKTSAESDFVGASDADIIVTVDTNDGTAKIIAIPRDTMVDVDLYSESGIFLRTDNMQLCLSYAYGDGGETSCSNVITSMSRILYNVPIQKYFALDLDGIAPLNDAIGGVTVESLYDFNELGIYKGDTVTLKGDMAESYVRTRDMDNINASLNRTQRQVQYIKAYSQQVVPAVMRDFSTISALYDTASKYSQSNLTLNNVTYLASLLMSKGITDFETYTLEGEMKESKASEFPDAVHAEFYPDQDKLMEIVLDVFYDQID